MPTTLFQRILSASLLAALVMLNPAQTWAQTGKDAGKEASKELAQMMLSGTDVNGKKMNLSDYAGKTVLVSFFSAGCNRCARDLKLMREFYVGNVKRQFVLLAVNIDRDKQDYDSYVQLIRLAVPKEQQFPVIWRHAAGHKDNFGNIISQPTHFVINPQGQLLWKREGTFQPDDWDNLWEVLG